MSRLSEKPCGSMKELNASDFPCLGVSQPLHCTPHVAIQYLFPSVSRSKPLIQTFVHTNIIHKTSMPDYGLPLGRLYGPAWLNGKLWKPRFKCVWTGELDQSNHHCPDCKGTTKIRCYDKLHVAFCLCLVKMPNGHHQFCGHRFQVESPDACFLHGWGKNNENRVFGLAKKGLDWSEDDLPSFLPHEQPGWEMEPSSLGHLQSLVCIRMKLIDGKQCFVGVSSRKAEPDQFIACVKPKELSSMTETGPRVALDANRVVLEEDDPIEGALQAFARAERITSVYDNPRTYEKYNKLASERAEAERLEEKKAKEARSAALATERAAAARSRKNCAQQAMKT
jgi:hypothetical protein